MGAGDGGSLTVLGIVSRLGDFVPLGFPLGFCNVLGILVIIVESSLIINVWLLPVLLLFFSVINAEIRILVSQFVFESLNFLADLGFSLTLLLAKDLPIHSDLS